MGSLKDLSFPLAILLAIVVSTTSDNICDGATETFFGYDADCTKYIACISDKEYIFNCTPPGTCWNKQLKYCDEECFNCSATTPMQPETTTNPTDNVCIGQEDGAELGYPYDCYKYIICIDETAFIVSCLPDDTCWNSNTQTCDKKSCSSCQTTTQPEPTTTSEPETTTLQPGPTTTPVDNICYGNNGKFFPYEPDCTKFISCISNTVYVFDCDPPGTCWNNQFAICDIACNNCSGTTQPGPTTTSEPAPTTTPVDNICYGNNGKFFPYEPDCTKFISCLSNTVYVFDCDPPGTCWNNQFGICDTACNNCSGTTQPEPSTTPVDNICYGNNGKFFPYEPDCTKFISCLSNTVYVFDCDPPGTCWNNQFGICDTACNNCSGTTQPEPSTTPVDNICYGNNGKFFPYEPDCTKFISCLSNTVYVFDCDPPGTCWNNQFGICDTACNNCSGTSPLPPLTTVSPSPGDPICSEQADGSFHADPSDCTRFVICEDGVSNFYDCPLGTGWNPISQKCDGSADCKSTTTLTPDVTTSINNACIEEPDGAFVADPSDCRKFIICQGGIAFSYDCGPGTSWNSEAHMCDKGDNCKNDLDWGN